MNNNKQFPFNINIFLLLIFLTTPMWAQTGRVFDRKDFRVQPGDAIRIKVYDGTVGVDKDRAISQFHEEIFIIDSEGNIHLLALGPVYVANLKQDIIEEILVEKLRPFANDDPIVFVEPMIRVIMRGGFKDPGLYRFSIDKTFWEIVEEAGGLAGSFAKDIVHIRKESELKQGFVEDLYEAQTIFDLGIESGDEIFAEPPSRISLSEIMNYTNFVLQIFLLYLTLDGRRYSTTNN